MDVPERPRFPGAAFLVAQFGIIVISPHRHLASSSSRLIVIVPGVDDHDHHA